MNWNRGSPKRFGVLLLCLAALLTLSLACAAKATPTPGPKPTVAPAPTVAPTPTRVAVVPPTPTATPVAKVAPVYGGHLRIAGEVVQDTLDPTYSEDYYSLLPFYGIYNSMVKMGADNQVQPDLAESWDFSSDGRDITFRLRRGVKFHDGTPFNADAVKFTFDRYMTESPGTLKKVSLRRSQLVDVESVTKVDDFTIKIRLKQAYRPFLALISERPGFILSPTAVKKDEDSFQKMSVGTGPFKVKEWLSNQRIVVVKNQDYFDPKEPYLDTITELEIPDLSVKFAMVRTGEVDIVDQIRTTDLPLAERNPTLKMAKNFGGRFEIIGITVDRSAPYNNVNFRRALGFALDRKALADVVWQGHAEPGYMPIGPASGAWYNPGLTPLKYDLAKAKEQLALGGFASGVEFKLPCASTAANLQHCEALQSIWAKAGIKAIIEPKPASGHWGAWIEGQFDMIVSWRAGRPDPHINIQRMYHCKGFSNPARYCNPEVDKLIDQAGREYDVAKAKKLYDQILDTAQNNGHEIIQVYPFTYVAMNKKVQGYSYYIDEIIRLRDLWMEK